MGQSGKPGTRTGHVEHGEVEIARLDNDPNFPENGKLDIILYGGL